MTLFDIFVVSGTTMSVSLNFRNLFDIFIIIGITMTTLQFRD